MRGEEGKSRLYKFLVWKLKNILIELERLGFFYFCLLLETDIF